MIVGSAAGLTPADQSIYDVAHLMARAGFDSASIAHASALRERMYDTSNDSLGRIVVAASVDSVHSAPWFQASALPYPFPVSARAPGQITFLRLEPAPIWHQVTVPVLAYWGGRDQRLPPAESRALVERELAHEGNQHLTTHVFPDADHVMTVTASPDSAGRWDLPRGVPYLSLIAEWLGDR